MEINTGTFSNSAPTLPKLNSRGFFLAVFILLVIALFVVELPPWLLDLLLVCNLAVSLTLLLRGLFMDSPLALFSFPTMLVLATLFRLALNVSSTKLILLHGGKGLEAPAGYVIKSFGNFVAGGDFAVGAIVFVIIAIVNFVVIAKGSARVAEVSARFNLDALPGRQLSLEAEMRNGTITREQAAARRSELMRESQFFGSMDGAMKWVQGDAVACLAIAAINAFCGVALGVLKWDLPFGDAVGTFGVLAIGDGLVTILPSLLISVSAGVIVTHVLGEEKRGTGEEIFRQLTGDPRTTVIVALALLATAVVGVFARGVPVMPFFAVASTLLLYVAGKQWFQTGQAVMFNGRSASALLPVSVKAVAQLPQPARFAQSAVDRGVVADDLDVIRVEANISPQSSVNAENGGSARSSSYEQYLETLKTRVFRERGISLPAIVLEQRPELPFGAYRVLVREEQVRSGFIQPNCVFCAANSSLLGLFGIKAAALARHPVEQRSAAWIDPRQRGVKSLEHLHVEVLAPAQFLLLEAVGAAFSVVEEIFGLAEARCLLEQIRESQKGLLAEVFDSARLSYAEFTEILRRLVKEKVNIRDVKLILEGIAEFNAQNGVPENRQAWLGQLHSFLRLVLSRSIINQAAGPGDKLRAFMLSPEVEDEFKAAVSMWDNPRSKPPLDPAFEGLLRTSAAKLFTPVLERGVTPVIVLCSDEIRAAVQDFFGREGHYLQALSFEELKSASRPESVGVLSVEQ